MGFCYRKMIVMNQNWSEFDGRCFFRAIVVHFDKDDNLKIYLHQQKPKTRH